VPDSILKLVPANGGVVMVNFNPGFVSEAVRVYEDSAQARSTALRAAGADSAALADSAKAWAKRAPHATLQQVADHIEHIRDMAGIDHVGLGSDFDGITSVPDGLENTSKFPDLVAELLRRGWKADDVKKLVGLNALSVMRDAAKAARRLQSASVAQPY
jgi:membrane dipeptidase